MKLLLFAAFILLFTVSGSFVTALMFIKYGDSWEYRYYRTLRLKH